MNWCIFLGGTILLVVGRFAVSSSGHSFKSFGKENRPSKRDTENNCSQKGYYCSADCKTVYNCVGSGKVYTEIIAEECDTDHGYYCSATLSTCSQTLSSKCTPRGYKFTCTAIGTFPDPYDCAGYYICYGAIGNLQYSFQQCEGGWLYDPSTFSCTIESKICTQDPVPSCKNHGQIGAVLGNPNIYYMCRNGTNNDETSLYPVLYLCPHGGIFDYELKSCQSITTISAISSRPQEVTTHSTTTQIYLTTENIPKCKGEEILADPNDCYSYYVCSQDLQQTHKICDEGYYFNDVYQNCVFGTCSNTNGNSGSQTNHPTGTTSNNTPAPGITTTTTESNSQTTKPSLTVKPCTAAGAIEDPNDCYSYYECSQDLQQTHKSCDVGYYFNDVYQNCVFGTCSNTNGNSGSQTNHPTGTTSNITPAPGVTTTTTESNSQTTKPSLTVQPCTAAGAIEDPNDCYSYYECSKDLQQTHKSCDVGYYFNDVYQNCVFGTCSNTNGNSGSQTNHPTGTTSNITPAPGVTTTTTESNSQTTKPSLTVQPCTAAGAIEDPNDCYSYYECSQDLQQTHKSCDVGYYFNDVYQNCVFGTCSNTNGNSGSQTNHPTGTTSNITPAPGVTTTTTESNSQTTKPSLTVQPCTAAGAIEDPNDCYSYYECSQDLQQTHKSCDVGYYFNDVYQNCVFGTCSNTNGNSGSQTNHPTGTTSNITPAPGVTTTTTESNSQTTKPSLTVQPCTAAGAIEDPNDCYSYYECSQDLQQTHKSCDVGYYFNDVYQNCVFGTCSNTNGNSGSQTNHPTGTTSNITPAPGVTTTTTESNSQTTKPSLTVQPCTAAGAIEDPNDCYSYYECSQDLQQTHKSCDVGYYFNDVYQNCVFGTCSNTNGNSGSQTNHPTGTTSNITPAPGVTTTTTESNSQTTKPSLTVQPCTAAGAIEDPNDCYSYYECSQDLQQTHKSCDVGYYFNDVYQNCVFGTCSNTNGNSGSQTNHPTGTTSNITPAPGVTTTTTESNSQTTKPSLTVQPCTAAGAIEDPNDCYSYYECSQDLQQTHKSCDVGYYFNDVYQNCVYGTCS